MTSILRGDECGRMEREDGSGRLVNISKISKD